MATANTAELTQLDGSLREQIERLVDERAEALWRAREEEKAQRPKKMALIATKGTLDWAYPPLILATTAAAMGWDVAIFFTFYGLNILNKPEVRKLEVAPLGNPAMPMPLPMPQLVGAIPGMTPMATTMMKAKFKQYGVASIDELIDAAVDCGVRLIPCGMTAEVFGIRTENLIPAAEPMCGAAAFISWAEDADVALFI